jgi:hypothetical protein
MMAIGDAEDIHVQRILVLCSPGYLALSREHMFEELFSLLALYLRSPRKPSIYPSHLFMNIAIHAAPGEQTEVLTKPSPVFVIRLKEFLPRGLVHPIEEVHIDSLILQEQVLDVVLL